MWVRRSTRPRAFTGKQAWELPALVAVSKAFVGWNTIPGRAISSRPPHTRRSPPSRGFTATPITPIGAWTLPTSSFTTATVIPPADPSRKWTPTQPLTSALRATSAIPTARRPSSTSRRSRRCLGFPRFLLGQRKRRRALHPQQFDYGLVVHPYRPTRAVQLIVSRRLEAHSLPRKLRCVLCRPRLVPHVFVGTPHVVVPAVVLFNTTRSAVVLKIGPPPSREPPPTSHARSSLRSPQTS